jgi:hypothetical protein
MLVSSVRCELSHILRAASLCRILNPVDLLAGPGVYTYRLVMAALPGSVVATGLDSSSSGISCVNNVGRLCESKLVAQRYAQQSAMLKSSSKGSPTDASPAFSVRASESKSAASACLGS